MSLASEQARFLERLLAATPEDSPGLAVYRRTLRANRDGALRAAYPVVARLVGDAFFAEAAERFGQLAPSRSGDLHGYGAGFAAFLADYPFAAGLPYLADVARLEWAVHRCGFAADPVPFDPAALAAVPAERQGGVRLVAQAGSALVESRHPVVSIWEAHQAEGDVEAGGGWEAECAVVYRRGLEVVVARAGDDAPLLSRLLGGATLAQACASEEDAAGLPRWVAAGLFRGIAP